MVSIGSIKEEEVLFKQMEEDDQIISEVSSIKNILDRHKYEDDEIILRLMLTRLQTLISSVDILKATNVEKTVELYKKHNLKTIRDLAQSLINEWKDMKGEWQKLVHQSVPTDVTSDYADDTDEFWGLPTPPLDYEAFQTDYTSTMMDITALFDGLDECENDKDTQTHAEYLKTKKQSHGRGKEMSVLIEVYKPDNLSYKGSSQEKLEKLWHDPKVCDRSNIPIRKKDDDIKTKKAMSECEDTYSLDLKFKSTQKRLHEGYNQAENEKKQRRIQIINYLPKQGSCFKKNHTKLGNSFRPRIIS